MELFSRKKKIQATEGARGSVGVLDGITWGASASGLGGTSNEYLTYGVQVAETYRKYNGQSAYGCASVRVIVDTRTAFIAGEGIALATDDEKFSAWAQSFLRDSKLSGSGFFEAVMGTEMTGRALFMMTSRLGTFPLVKRIAYKGEAYRISSDGRTVYLKEGNTERAYPAERFLFIRTGGDDTGQDEPTTRVGLVLTDCENYERALKEIRLTNYTTSRITPTFKTESDSETTSLTANLKTAGWRIGQAFVGKAAFKYEGAPTSALDNLKTELSSTTKNISAVTGVPVHWFGWTDLMSNRATAEDLYQMIANATSRERTLIAEGMYDLIVKAQASYIDAGGTDISAINRDFTVTIPSIDYGRFESLVRALSVAYNDKAISIDDYRSYIPGIDPLETKRAVEAATEANKPEPIDLLAEDDEDEDAQATPEQKPAPQSTPLVEGAATNIASTALNGAQVASLMDLATQVSTGQLPLLVAKAIARAAFPFVDESVLSEIFTPLEGFVPESRQQEPVK